MLCYVIILQSLTTLCPGSDLHSDPKLLDDPLDDLPYGQRPIPLLLVLLPLAVLSLRLDLELL
jgi:hypothetical protein